MIIYPRGLSKTLTGRRQILKHLNMKTYKVTVLQNGKEHPMLIEAENEKEAKLMAEKQWKNGKSYVADYSIRAEEV